MLPPSAVLVRLPRQWRDFAARHADAWEDPDLPREAHPTNFLGGWTPARDPSLSPQEYARTLDYDAPEAGTAAYIRDRLARFGRMTIRRKVTAVEGRPDLGEVTATISFRGEKRPIATGTFVFLREGRTGPAYLVPRRTKVRTADGLTGYLDTRLADRLAWDPLMRGPAPGWILRDGPSGGLGRGWISPAEIVTVESDPVPGAKMIAMLIAANDAEACLEGWDRRRCASTEAKPGQGWPPPPLRGSTYSLGEWANVLKSVYGHPIYRALEASFPDTGTVVPSLAGYRGRRNVPISYRALFREKARDAVAALERVGKDARTPETLARWMDGTGRNDLGYIEITSTTVPYPGAEPRQSTRTYTPLPSVAAWVQNLKDFNEDAAALDDPQAVVDLFRTYARFDAPDGLRGALALAADPWLRWALDRFDLPGLQSGLGRTDHLHQLAQGRVTVADLYAKDATAKAAAAARQEQREADIAAAEAEWTSLVQTVPQVRRPSFMEHSPTRGRVANKYLDGRFNTQQWSDGWTARYHASNGATIFEHRHPTEEAAVRAMLARGGFHGA